MKIYTIAQGKSKCCGHGDYRMDYAIRQFGYYPDSGYPPCFTNRSDAEKYLLARTETESDLKIVELELLETFKIKEK